MAYFVSLLLVASLLPLLAPASAHASNPKEIESNDTTAKATAIRLGTTYSGSTHSSSTRDVDFYAVDIPSAGRVSVNLKFPNNLGTGKAYDVVIMDAQGKWVYSFSPGLGESSGKPLSDQGTYLPKGRAYVKIEGDKYSASWGKTYTLNVGHTPGNVELENNGTTSSATPIKLGTTYSGSTLRFETRDVDFYAVDMPHAGQMYLDLKFPTNLGSGNAYDVTVLNAHGSKIYSTRLNGAHGTGTGLASTKIVVPQGRAYVKVEGDKYSKHWGKTYTLNVKAALKTTPTPKVSGTAKVGSTLTAKAGTWAPSPVTVKYQWMRNGKAIKDATKSTYKLVTADGGTKITVKVTGSKANYRTVSKTSASKSVPHLKL